MTKIAVVSLGCNKNLVDSEMILGLLVKRGYEIVSDEALADIIIINTLFQRKITMIIRKRYHCNIQ